jgi:hypothetical protein
MSMDRIIKVRFENMIKKIDITELGYAQFK